MLAERIEIPRRPCRQRVADGTRDRDVLFVLTEHEEHAGIGAEPMQRLLQRAFDCLGRRSCLAERGCRLG